MPRRKRKILLIGASGYEQTSEDIRVYCFLWPDVCKIQNIRDYDTIILDLLKLTDEDTRKTVDWSSVHRVLNFRNANEILANGGTIIVLGDPRFQVPVDPQENNDSESYANHPFLRWTGIKYAWDDEPGDTVHFQDDYEHRQFKNYVAHLIKWDYSLQACKISDAILAKAFNLEYMKKNDLLVDISKDFFCINRYRNALAFTLRLELIKREAYDSRDVINTYGPLIFLPKITLKPDNTRQLVLSDICGIDAPLVEPDWISEYVAPGQMKIDSEIQRIETDLQTARKNLQSAKDKRAHVRDCLKLLYEREYSLEPVTRDILRGLGAHVEDPSEPNKEDGWIVVRGKEATHEGVLEIKSTRSDQFDEEGRKQLLDWIDRGRTKREKEYKGIFIGNSAVDKPLKERTWAFSDSWVKAAKLSGICALKTEDLYVIHLLNARGAINIDSFWQELFSTNGVFNMKHYWELSAPKDDQENS